VIGLEGANELRVFPDALLQEFDSQCAGHRVLKMEMTRDSNIYGCKRFEINSFPDNSASGCVTLHEPNECVIQPKGQEVVPRRASTA
jgi:hypothetical protein